ncbi:baseplate hub subunit [Prochlorococcus phage P-HM2]|uniref:Baseplate hub subunit n=1 Tax=Prochlorococcus phage P-HM2 TaxID=445696 RepID=E3SSM0_9CAUD|nr:baseplate hub [Prochlorococcus phage P-HM2]ADO99798.1 baseplate hub subunit [Prochlorococcus phage P-HM2]|tara:strand:- start:550 stop:1248 length:699 start_codon:yes stop_codon:yes gene_type:complete
MALPEIATPIYTLTVPSTKKRVKYRPFLVKEQKLLILALENDDQEQILDAITKTIQNCLHTKIKVEDMALFDIEYLFLQIRARSISEEIEMKVTCADDGETTVDVKFMVDDVKVNFPKGHTNVIKIDDDLTVEMKYPDLDYFTKVNFIGEEPDAYELVAKCIKRVYVGEDDYTADSVEESKKWVEGLTNAQFDKIQAFFETMPTLKHVLKVKNPKTKVANEVVLEGLSDFFA